MVYLKTREENLDESQRSPIDDPRSRTRTRRRKEIRAARFSVARGRYDRQRSTIAQSRRGCLVLGCGRVSRRLFLFRLARARARARLTGGRSQTLLICGGNKRRDTL